MLAKTYNLARLENVITVVNYYMYNCWPFLLGVLYGYLLNLNACIPPPIFLSRCGVNQVATADGTACTSRSDCLSSPCQNGGLCQDMPGQQYPCLCSDSYTGQRCELARERQTIKLGYPALFTIVGCLILILCKCFKLRKIYRVSTND